MTHGVQIRYSTRGGSQEGSEGLDTCDYLVYPVGAALTDKPRTQTGIPKHLCDIGAASELAARLFNHVLNQQCNGLRFGLETGAGSLRLPNDAAEPDFARLPYR